MYVLGVEAAEGEIVKYRYIYIAVCTYNCDGIEGIYDGEEKNVIWPCSLGTLSP